jgi:pyruvate dehydrogenase E1 component beta subunit
VVAAPNTPADNKGLLKSAIRCDDPVIYIEHKDNWALEGEVPDDPDHLVPLGQARLALPRDDLTLVTWSKMVGVAEQAAALALAQGVGIEVIDLRTLWPWDQDMVFASVAKTKRLLVVHEAVQVGGFGAEIAATVAEHMAHVLTAPIRRLGAPRAPISYAKPLEDLLRITPEKILATALSQMAVTA